jgi:small-conductance mechanosensitive channel
VLDPITWQLAIAIVILGSYAILASRWKRIPAVPVGLLLTYLGFRLGAEVIRDQEWAAEWAIWIHVGASVLLAWAIARLSFYLAVELPLKLRKRKELPNITRDLILIVCYAILLLIVLRTRSNINLASLITTSAVLTVVVGFAAQTTLSGLISGLILQIERPFSIGDWIKFNDYTGRVVGINWKSTLLLTRDQVLVYVPNSQITNNSFANFSRPDERLIARLSIGLEYGAPPNLVRRVIVEVLNGHPKILKIPQPEVRLVEFGDFAITYEIRFWHTSYFSEPRIKADINNQLWYALRRHRINIPFPIRDVQFRHIEQRRQAEVQELEKRTAEIQRLFAQIAVLSALSEDEQVQVAQRAGIADYGEGEYIVRQGEPGDSLYIIRKGSCDVFIRGDGDREKKVAHIETGGFFGEMSLLTGEARNATVKAAEDTSVITIDKLVFSTIITANPNISVQLGEVLTKRQKELTAAGALTTAAPSSKNMIAKIKFFFGID